MYVQILSNVNDNVKQKCFYKYLVQYNRKWQFQVYNLCFNDNIIYNVNACANGISNFCKLPNIDSF